ncbi:HAD-IIB family hydrolase [Salinisphaera sp. P385]|uniref:HAD-IIB family hydrolase n=1 Tax=Spectribacter acetivorans TaxID=3075603 RepID=A0ABU3BAV7_9GAMM|nr:HAD-IIB family hydrolase [Salinisphaera sp. P385]MDT0619601.1 HAD-IIB family hydrolase [Salinisphaera sp. P385]
MPRWVVYTDLDGTLLDHYDYGWQAAVPALTALAVRDVPVVPVTSKTLAEMQVLRTRLAPNTPFVVENGGAVAVPTGYFGADRGTAVAGGLYVERLGPGYADIVDVLIALRAEGFAFTGFADMDATAVAACTGLVQADAERARQRLCSEPLLWQGSDEALAEFRVRLANHGLTTRRGGRFLHVMGQCDKGDALRRLQAHFGGETAPISLALGDSPNDFDMLVAADRGVLVARPDGSHAAPPDPPGLVHAPGIGPAGWNAAVLDWLAEIFDNGND